jgi:predicted nucleic acid-binding Zn ribbon protein
VDLDFLDPGVRVFDLEVGGVGDVIDASDDDPLTTARDCSAVRATVSAGMR